MDKRFAISDEDLELVSGGVASGAAVMDDSQAGGHCPHCTQLMNRTADGGYVCPNCGAVYDKSGRQIGGSGYDQNNLSKKGVSSFGSSLKKK